MTRAIATSAAIRLLLGASPRVVLIGCGQCELLLLVLFAQVQMALIKRPTLPELMSAFPHPCEERRRRLDAASTILEASPSSTSRCFDRPPFGYTRWCASLQLGSHSIVPFEPLPALSNSPAGVEAFSLNASTSANLGKNSHATLHHQHRILPDFSQLLL